MEAFLGAAAKRAVEFIHDLTESDTQATRGDDKPRENPESSILSTYQVAGSADAQLGPIHARIYGEVKPVKEAVEELKRSDERERESVRLEQEWDKRLTGRRPTQSPTHKDGRRGRGRREWRWLGLI